MLPLKEIILRQQYYPVNFKKRTTMNTVKFKDLSEAELKKYNGGFPFLPWIFGIMTSGMIYDSVAHWGETSASFKKGFKAGVADY